MVADVAERACAREKIAVLVERHCHDPIGQVEGLLHAVTMMDVYVYVQDPAQQINFLSGTDFYSAGYVLTAACKI